MRPQGALLIATLLLAGCAAPGGQLDPSGATQAGPLDPLTEAVFGFGEFLQENVASFDGVPIHIDVQLPDGDGPFPTLIEFTPYSSTLNANDELAAQQSASGDKEGGAIGVSLFYVPRGYAVAVAHVRGSGQSGGCFDVGGPNEGKDGHALVEWVANQSWSNGRVAMLGTSYVGTTPISTAVTNPPHLTTIVPVSAVSEWYRYYFENGEQRFLGSPDEFPTGAVYADHALWAATGLVPKPRNPTAADPASNAQCGAAQMEQAWLQDDYTDYWRERNYVKDLPNATAPMLYAHGFLDDNTATSLVGDFFNAYPAEKRMWLQQHGHGVPGSFEAYHEYVHRWLDHYLLGLNNGALDLAPVVIQDNLGKYHTDVDWPPRNASLTVLHLGEGALLAEPPADGSASYLDDARTARQLDALDATPLAGARMGAGLRFETEPLAAPLHLTGSPRVELLASSDKADTQFGVVLYDVAPDGRASFITRGYLDARHADSLAKGVDLVPGEERLFAWDMHPRDHRVEEGHALRLYLVSSDEYVTPDAPGATNTIYFGAAGSRLILPVLGDDVAFADEAPIVG